MTNLARRTACRAASSSRRGGWHGHRLRGHERVYGPIYGASRAEAASVDVAAQRAQAMSGQFVMDVHTHFLRDDTSTEQQFPHLTPYARVDDLGKAAKDWPQIRFIVYHSAYRWTPGSNAHLGLKQFDATGRVEWTSDLAEIPEKYGVSNVYADLGQIFAQTTVIEPRLCAALMGMLVKGVGVDHIV